ncbi:MAG: hypothetical protein M3P00_03155 [Gemmatimonadota bacterium]|nr:hypothetical protein [Gemmatimonadota bacterium]
MTAADLPNTELLSGWIESQSGSVLGNCRRMDIAAAIILVLLVLLPFVVVIALFVWAARKDGQADRALQARLGIRRRTRLGR